MTLPKPLLLVLFTMLLVVACGGGSGGGSDNSPTSEKPAGGSQETVEEGGGSSSQFITDLNGRSMAIDVMELLGVALGYEGQLESGPEISESGDCKEGARVAASADAQGNTEVNYDQCKNSIGGLEFTVNGKYVVSNLEGSTSIKGVEGSPITINDGQGTWTIEPFELNIKSSAGLRSLDIMMNLVSSRYNHKLTVTSEQSLTGSNLLCPDGGKLLLKAEDETSVTIIGQPGENLMLDINGENKTLACSEVSVNATPSLDSGLMPPPAP
jgi:hypothetical protein